jgi:hypothetical protein
MATVQQFELSAIVEVLISPQRGVGRDVSPKSSGAKAYPQEPKPWPHRRLERLST